MRNRIIIGDNTMALRSDVLADYIGAVKMIYIDPPYNTNTSKSYCDKKDSSCWLSGVSDSIKASHKYLRQDGVIFISIDDNEYAYLKVACDRIFGRENFVGTFITRQSQRSNSNHINVVHEYILCYAKDKRELEPFKIKRTDVPELKAIIDNLSVEVKRAFDFFGKKEAVQVLNDGIKKICNENGISWIKNYSSVDDDGRIYFAKDLSTPGNPRKVEIPSIGLHLDPLPTRGWSSDKKFLKVFEENNLVFKGGRPYEKYLLSESADNVQSVLYFYSRQGTNDLNKLGLRDLFDTPKPVELIKFLIRISSKKDDIIMDYYAGSGTTAQAVYEINNEDLSDRHYILIQSKESVRKNTDTFKSCEKYGVKPYVSEILLFRLKIFLQKSETRDNYELLKVC